jgi:hypothetical protein
MNIVVTKGTHYSDGGAAFDTAVNYVVAQYDALFTANVTVYINVDYGIIDSTNQTVAPLGRSNYNLDSFSYSTVRQALINMGAAGANTLPATSPFLNATLWLSTAQEKALGLLAANFRPGSTAFYPNQDGYVGIASNQTLTAQLNDTWSFSPTATPAANQFYIVGALEHEFSEVLGRFSLDGTNAINNTPSYTIMDLFRYASPNVREFNPSQTAYFSINNGTTNLDFWNNKSIDANGDLGDWAASAGPDAYLNQSPPGQINGITQADKIVMNAIGWNETPPPNAAPPPGTTADMIMRHGADGQYYIYDIGGNALLAAYKLGQVGTNWVVAGLGSFQTGDTTDMLLRDNNTGGFEVYDVKNNNITNAAFLGTVGSNWATIGFGNFSSLGETDMLMRTLPSGGIEVYDIKNNQITNAAFLGAIGSNWLTAGISNHGTESDLVERNFSTGDLEIYDINRNQITGAALLGRVGLDWTTLGFGNFSGRGTGDMIMRNTRTGGLEVYDIANNAITGAAFIGTVGLDWQFAGIGPVHAPGASDLVLRNANTGAFEVYDIAGNALVGAASLGAVGSDWSVGGLAVDPPGPAAGRMGAMDAPELVAGSMGASDAAAAQLVQAMAGFGDPAAGRAADLNTTAGGADALQQQFLTTSQHA